MSSTKYTQGAWEVMAGELQDMIAVGAESDDLNNGYVIAMVNGSDRVANARLIATAPELLAALSKLVVAIDDSANNSTRRESIAVSRAMIAARAVIARAEGSQ